MSARPLIAALTLAVAGLSFIGVGAYKKYHKPHVPAPVVAVTPIALPTPVPLPKPVPIAVVTDTECKPGKLPNGTYVTSLACDALLKDAAKAKAKAMENAARGLRPKAKPKPRAVKKNAPAPSYVEAKTPPKPKVKPIAARLKEDAKGGKAITCDEVKWYVATYPKWVLDQFAKLATEEQKERGKKCFQ